MRAELITAIWPDEPPVDPGSPLRTQLSHLRRRGSEAVAAATRLSCGSPRGPGSISRPLSDDPTPPNHALKAGDSRRRLGRRRRRPQRRRPPVALGFDASWLDDVRPDLGELEFRAREVVAGAGIGLGGSEIAIAERSARALIRAAPFRETGYLYLMRALVASGKTAEALRTYDELRRLLNTELGTAPSAAVQALHSRLLS